jgi:hypothetical protein
MGSSSTGIGEAAFGSEPTVEMTARERGLAKSQTELTGYLRNPVHSQEYLGGRV